ncbi:MAG: STAS domain-containing protein [Planctomycetaceae bacterium]
MPWKSSLLRQCATNRILLVEIWGHAIIVTPRGDASGFGDVEFKHEQQILDSLVRHEQIKHVIIDFKQSSYFGNEMTAVLMHLADLCKNLEKTCALCHVSDAMRIPLRDLQKNPFCDWYDNRKIAERKLAHLTAGERVQRLVLRRDFRLIVILAITCLLGLWVNSLRTPPNDLLTYCDTLETIMKQHRHMRDRGYSPQNWDEALAGFRTDVERISSALENDTTPAAEELKLACQPNLISLFEQPWTGSNQQIEWDRNAEQHLIIARRIILTGPDEADEIMSDPSPAK